MSLSPWVVMESIHGKFIINRYCAFQIDYLAKTGATHIESEIAALVGIANTLPDGCLIIDAGANIGLISVPLAQAVKDRGGKVIAYEVQCPLYQALCGSAVLNDLDNLFPRNMGLSDQFESVKHPDVDYHKPSDYGLVSFVDRKEHEEYVYKGDEHYTKQMVLTAIDFLSFSRLDLLKIDVEGMEFQVLTGARRSLEQFRPWCWVEYFMSDVEALKSCFDGLDYTFFRMDAQNMLCAPRKRLVESGFRIEAEPM